MVGGIWLIFLFFFGLVDVLARLYQQNHTVLEKCVYVFPDL